MAEHHFSPMIGRALVRHAKAPVIAVSYAILVVLGARVAAGLSTAMMNDVALAGAWMMAALVTGYITARFRPRMGAALLAGFALAAVVVAILAGMHMM